MHTEYRTDALVGYTICMSVMSLHVVGGFAHAFPPPKYLTMPAAGIDVSDYSIKHMSLRRTKKAMRIDSWGKVDLPAGVVDRGEVKESATFTKLLERVREEHRYEYVHVALPEEHAYLFQTELPRASHAEITQMLEFHLKENVPIGADEALFDYNIIKERPDAFVVNVSVYPSSLANAYLACLEDAGLVPISLEIEGQATARALIPPDQMEPILVVDIGRNEASVSISKGGIVTFTANLDTGGDFFTRAVARGLDISFQEAEKLKRAQGFRDTKENSTVFETLVPVAAELRSNLRKHLVYWQQHAVSGDVADVAKVVLVGGSANILGLTEYLEAELGVPVETGSVWRNVFPEGHFVPEIHAAHSLEFATAVGLALRSGVHGG